MTTGSAQGKGGGGCCWVGGWGWLADCVRWQEFGGKGGGEGGGVGGEGGGVGGVGLVSWIVRWQEIGGKGLGGLLAGKNIGEGGGFWRERCGGEGGGFYENKKEYGIQ